MPKAHSGASTGLKGPLSNPLLDPWVPKPLFLGAKKKTVASRGDARRGIGSQSRIPDFCLVGLCTTHAPVAGPTKAFLGGTPTCFVTLPKGNPLGMLILRRLQCTVWVIIPEFRRNRGAYICPLFLLFYRYNLLFGPLSFTNGAIVFRTQYGMVPQNGSGQVATSDFIPTLAIGDHDGRGM